MQKVSVVIPCYGPPEDVERCIAALAIQWKREDITVIMVDDCSPYGGYDNLIKKYGDKIEIKLIRNEKNLGQGLSRQAGIDMVETDIFVMSDEDDVYQPLALSQLVGVYESHYIEINPDGTVVLDDNGEPKRRENVPEVAVVSGALFEWDDYHTKIIPSHSTVWINGKLYNKKFLEKHNVRFNEASSHKSEDYYWSSCLYYALDNDPKYTGIILSDDNPLYLWYPRETSRSRIDKHYGFALSPNTTLSSCHVLDFIKECKTVKWTEEVERQYKGRVLNMTCYSYYTFMSYIRHVATTDFDPEEKYWNMLKDACNNLRERTKEFWGEYFYEQKQDELYRVRNMTDCQITPAWVEFDDYVIKGMEELSWDYSDLIKSKEEYTFNDDGVLTKK